MKNTFDIYHNFYIINSPKLQKMKTAIIVVIGCEPNCATKRIALFRDSDLESAIEKLADFKPLSYDNLDQQLTMSGISVYGHGDLINELVNKLTAGE